MPVRLAAALEAEASGERYEKLIEDPGHSLLEDVIGAAPRLAPVAGDHGCLYLLHGPPQNLRLGTLLRIQSWPAAE